LADADDPRAEALIFLAFLSDDEQLSRAALKACEKLGLSRLWGNVAIFLAHPNWRLRGKASTLLGKWGVKDALIFLMSAGLDPDPWVEEERQKAIKLLS